MVLTMTTVMMTTVMMTTVMMTTVMVMTTVVVTTTVVVIVMAMVTMMVTMVTMMIKLSKKKMDLVVTIFNFHGNHVLPSSCSMCDSDMPCVVGVRVRVFTHNFHSSRKSR